LEIPGYTKYRKPLKIPETTGNTGNPYDNSDELDLEKILP
jgi:hypothetical protein